MSLALIERWQKNPIHQALAQHPYREYVLSNIPNLLGLWIQRTTVGWLTWEMTHSVSGWERFQWLNWPPPCCCPYSRCLCRPLQPHQGTSNYPGTDFSPSLVFCLLLLNNLLTLLFYLVWFCCRGYHELCSAFTDGTGFFNGSSSTPDIRCFTQRNHLQPGKISWTYAGGSWAGMAESNHFIGL